MLLLTLSIATTQFFFKIISIGEYHAIESLGVTILSFYLYSILTFRVLLGLFPIREGEIKKESKQEFIFHVYLLFNLIVFYPLTRCGGMPIPLFRIFYLALGAKLGKNTYCTGIIFDPLFVSIGDNTLIGQYGLVIQLIVEKERLAHYPISIGTNVTIGANASVFAGVAIGDDVIIAAGSVIKKGTTISDGEVWGGVPAKKIILKKGLQNLNRLQLVKA